MKKFLGTTMIVFLTLIAVSQPVKQTNLKGIVRDAENRMPLPSAIIKLGNTQTIADENGMFNFNNLPVGNYQLTAWSMGFKTFTSAVTIEDKQPLLDILLHEIPLYLQALEVKAIRASANAPFAKTNISKDQIAQANFGQDLPFLLNQTPSVVINSDAGNGVGYTGIHIRGSDATRINVTLNGIPYNDAESMGTYFVDLPDFPSSINSIQIQRGVGTSSNGAGAFGATLNLATNEFNEKSSAEFNNSFGSFNTWKNTVKVGSGLISDHFTVDARISRISSDGYIDRASTNLQSFYFSTAYINKKASLRLNVFSGKEKTYQAWYGVPEDTLPIHRRYNAAGTEKPGSPYNNETDNYTQTHYQLFFNYAITKRWSFNAAYFITKGKGYYEEYKAGQAFSAYSLPNVTIGGSIISSTDLIRQRWLDNDFHGQIISLQYKDQKDEFTIGGGWTKYQGQHFGNIIWMQTGTVSSDYRYYNYPATKNDANIYAKWMHKINNQWQSFLDLQFRHISHHMIGFEGNANLEVKRSFDFINPKAGITYTHNGWQAYLSYALGNKEPNRDDFQASPISQPKSETLNDFELGIEKKNKKSNYGATLFYMNYLDQLVLTGQVSDVGAYTRTNIPNSYRLGLELQASAIINNWIDVSGNITFSKNRIKSFTEYIDNWDTGLQDSVMHQNTSISFSPDMIGALTINLHLKKNLDLNLLSKYVSSEYLDNSQNATRKLGAYFTQDVRLAYTIKNKIFKDWHIIGQLNNLLNTKYQPNGYSYTYIYNKAQTNANAYYPMAEINFILTLNISL